MSRSVQLFNQGIDDKNSVAAEIEARQNGRFDPVILSLGKRSIDANIADGKRQRTFVGQQTPVLALMASQRSAQGIISERRPVLSRNIDEDYA